MFIMHRTNWGQGHHAYIETKIHSQEAQNLYTRVKFIRKINRRAARCNG